MYTIRFAKYGIYLAVTLIIVFVSCGCGLTIVGMVIYGLVIGGGWSGDRSGGQSD
jgi:hypothetical protein